MNSLLHKEVKQTLRNKYLRRLVINISIHNPEWTFTLPSFKTLSPRL